MPWCLGPCGQKKKGHHFFDTPPVKGLSLCPLPLSESRLVIASVKQNGGSDPVSSEARS